MERDLVGYLLRLDDDETLARIEGELRSNPELGRQLAALTRALAPLAADREAPLPPPELVTRTVGRVAEHLIEIGETPFEPADGPPVGEMLSRLTPQRLRALIEVMDRASAPPSRVRR